MDCCIWMRTKLGNMNMNGITVVPRERYGGRFFVVRFRWVDPVFWEKLVQPLPQMTPFATAAEIAINNCPGCGANLSELIRDNPAQFDALLNTVVD